MVLVKKLGFVLLCMVAFVGPGCRRSDAPSGISNSAPVAQSDPDYQHGKEAMIQLAQQLDKSGDHRMVVLPNFHAGPHIPLPIDVNFYEVLHDFPAYLVCIYDVNDGQYDSSKEPAWFKASLLQIRSSGQQSFYLLDRGHRSSLDLRWVAVILINRAEWNGAAAYEQAHKAGAIFNIDDVFDRSRDLSQLVAAAQIDRHPFVYDPNRGESWETAKHERWVIVEKHAATTRPTDVLK
ncbi:MAG: hypothetical protein ABSH22_12120 [Tepidisphaeraceae bacterium]|jgi:hypothetical protein